MHLNAPPRARTRRVPGVVVGSLAIALAAVVTVTVMAGTAGSPSVSSSPSSFLDVLRGDDRGRLGVADGAVPDGTTPFDDDVPAVANLDAALLGALRSAATDAARDGVQIQVTSGWRSAAYQEHLLEDAIAEHGSEAAAARWVSTPETSLHVSGDAVDVGGVDAQVWLAGYGAAYGLCRIYVNEPWHYELRPQAAEEGCPPPYDDPTQDPRMRP